MSARALHAVTRFGLGPRPDQPLPADPKHWLLAQIRTPAPLPGPDAADCRRVSRLRRGDPGFMPKRILPAGGAGLARAPPAFAGRVPGTLDGSLVQPPLREPACRGRFLLRRPLPPHRDPAACLRPLRGRGSTARPGRITARGGAAFLLGGAVADWPGFLPSRLLKGRDLLPTLDLRRLAKATLRDHLALPEEALEHAFTGSLAVTPLPGLFRSA